MVMPRSRSSSLLSRMSSPFCSFSRKRLAVYNILSTKVVLPWSTCAMIAIFLMFCISAYFVILQKVCKGTTFFAFMQTKNTFSTISSRHSEKRHKKYGQRPIQIEKNRKLWRSFIVQQRPLSTAPALYDFVHDLKHFHFGFCTKQRYAGLTKIIKSFKRRG